MYNKTLMLKYILKQFICHFLTNAFVGSQRLIYVYAKAKLKRLDFDCILSCCRLCPIIHGGLKGRH